MKYLKMQRTAHNAFCLLLVVEAPDFFVWPIIGTVVDGDYVLISIDESKIDKHFLATFMATSKGRIRKQKKYTRKERCRGYAGVGK
jgi:hypothetical protein